MEEPTYSHHGEHGYLTEQRESHWLPALRPEDETDRTNETANTITIENADDRILEPVLSAPEPTIYHSVTYSRDDSNDQKPSSQASSEDSAHEPDGKLDPAWGFKRVDSAHLLDSAKRSSSFPKMPPQIEPDNELLSSQDYAVSQPDDVDFNDLVNSTQPAVDEVAPAYDPTYDHVPAQPEQLEQPARAYGIEQKPDGVFDSRFEEGIPLIPSSQSPPQPISASTEIPLHGDAFGTFDTGSEEASFFSQIPEQPTSDHTRDILERKSTKDVIDSLHIVQREKEAKPEDTFYAQLADGAEQDDAAFFIEQNASGSKNAATGDADSKWAAVLDDDEEFLVEDADDLLPDSDPESPSSFMASLREEDPMAVAGLSTASDVPNRQQQSSVPQTPTNPYAPHQPSTSAMTQLSPKAHGNVGFTRPGLAPMGSFQNHLQQPSGPSRSESFADQAKGGYKSPYDLPMELSKPKKRAQPLRVASQPQGVPPPPRTSSMSSQSQLQSPFSPNNSAFGLNTAAIASPPTGNRITSAPVTLPTSKPRQSSNSSSFFEELPMVTKPRPRANSGRYTPSQNFAAPPPQLPPPSSPPQRRPSSQVAASPPRISDPYAQYQLQPPERVDPYANTALQPSSLPVPGVSASRYSPAPGSVPGAPRPTISPRYSPAPPSQPPSGPGRYASQPASIPSGQNAVNNYASQPSQPPPPPSAAQSFLPRTSSPLAYQGRGPAGQNSNLMPPPPLPVTAQLPQAVPGVQPPLRQNTPPVMPPPQPNGLMFSPPKPSDTPNYSAFAPPKRSQTQSPSRQLPRSGLSHSVESGSNRPTSAYSQVPPVRAVSHLESIPANRSFGQPKVAAPELDFEPPQNELQEDPLQRWRGAPVFKFGFGGVIVSSFPKHTPRYRAGQIKPYIKPGAGEVKTRPSKDISLLPEHVTTFPGPLKGKSKKKDLLSWMTTTIAKFENDAPVILGEVQALPDPRKCHEELVLLWKIVKIIVEHDGIIENKPEALKALNIILSPEVHAIDESTASQYRNDTELTGIYRPAGTTARSDAVDPLAVEELRKHLLKGEREQAVWKAADSRLWSHALLIASTISDDRKTWKQVVQEFVRQEVKPIGNNSESLSALYEIFGGNMEESIDELVPPSARAGLQMVSKIESSGPTKNALDGLDRWKETLSLVLNNRTSDDQRALATLGALLGNYGRVEAAHICFLFARNPLSPNVFGGLDDKQASITLLGVDQRARPLSFHQDYNALLLTEAYEFAISTLAPTQMSMSLPHLSAYKFERALDLADNGYKTEAQAYCDAIASGLTSKTKTSPYYHASLLVEVDDLAKRLKQVPVQSTSWIAKPSVEKATSSLLSKLSNFVAGDDSDAESKGSANDVGPFAKKSGSPNLSRSGSQTDLYSAYPSMTPMVPATAAGSRYAPGGITSTRSSTELTRGRPSLDSQRSPPTTSHGYESRQSAYAPSTSTSFANQSPARNVNAYQSYGASPSRKNYQPSPSRSNYQATPPQTSYMPETSLGQLSPPSQGEDSQSYEPIALADEQSPYMPSQPEYSSQQQVEQPAFGGYTPDIPPVQDMSQDIAASQAEEDTTAGYDQPQSYGYGYEPPADTGYVPYQPESDSDNDSKKQKPKKKAFKNDDSSYSGATSQTTFTAPAQNDTAAKKKANDEAADAAFRAAAEADAQRAKDEAAQKKSGGWLGGWFGGKKADTSLDTPAPKSSHGADNKVIRAKLGEDKMKLYYDKDLKKWVNPDDPDSLKGKTSTPPPPPGRSPAPPIGAGPPRAGGTPAPPMIGSRSSTPASAAGDSAGPGLAANLPPSVNAGLGMPSNSTTPAPPSGSGTPPPGYAAGLAPPRPTSNASSIDDLIGPATGARKGAKGRTAKKGRYVDVMAQ